MHSPNTFEARSKRRIFNGFPYGATDRGKLEHYPAAVFLSENKIRATLFESLHRNPALS
jgi:hypothetical protein